MAFEYTMTVRLSPYWNKVGTYFVKGKHFLTDCGVLDAVTVSIFIENDREFVMRVKGYKGQMPTPQLSDFIFQDATLQDFKAGTIDGINIVKQEFYKFPSMLTAKTVSLHQKLPQSCPFRSYADLRRHWKNMYGFRLPESDENLYYVDTEITLYGKIDRKLYPIVCGRRSPPNFTPALADQKISETFANFLYSKMAKCCDYSINITPIERPTLTPQIKDFTQNISLCTPTQAPACLTGSSEESDYEPSSSKKPKIE